MTSQQYWLKLKLPDNLTNLNMKELMAVRLLVQKAFNAGKKNA